MKVPKRNDFAFKSKGEIEKIKYLALEGGGGKGNVYLGALQALELLGKLPLTPENKDANGKKNVIQGIAGASAGSITSFLLALGCDSKQIKEVMSEYDFNDFYEVPIKGVYKCVTKEGGRNVFRIATDKITKDDKEILVDKGGNNKFFDSITGRPILIKKNALRITHAGNKYNNIDDAINSGKKNHRKLGRLFYHRTWAISKFMSLVVNNAINSFLLGFLRTFINGTIKRFFLDTAIKYTDSDILKKWRDLQDTNPKDRKFVEKATLFGGGILGSQLFNYLVKWPFWKTYGLFIKESTNRSIVSNNIATILGNEYADDYFDCMKFDRAMYSGIEVRNFFTNATITYLIVNFKIQIIVDINISNAEIVNSDIKNNVQLMQNEILALQKSRPLDYTGQLEKDKRIKELTEKIEQLESNTLPTIETLYPWISKKNIALLKDIQSNFQAQSNDLRLEDIVNITFGELIKITENDIRVNTTNMSKNIPCVFSNTNTPDFPVIDAVCMSMSIPFTFKPTFVDTNVVVGGKGVDNEDYYGFHVDGGMLNNFPLHLYDNDASGLNNSVLGIRLSDGYPNDKYRDTKEDKVDMKIKSKSYFEDPLYRRFLEGKYRWERKEKNQDEDAENDSRKAQYLRTTRHTISIKEEIYNGSAGMLLEYLQNAFDTGIYYYGEEGQFRSAEERSQALELFCYPVGLFDFAPTKKLVKEAFSFTQARSLLKSAAWFGISIEEIEDLLKEYYKDVIDVEEPWSKIKERLIIFYASCRE